MTNTQSPESRTTMMKNNSIPKSFSWRLGRNMDSDRIPFNITYNPANPNMKQIIDKHWNPRGHCHMKRARMLGSKGWLFSKKPPTKGMFFQEKPPTKGIFFQHKSPTKGIFFKKGLPQRVFFQKRPPKRVISKKNRSRKGYDSRENCSRKGYGFTKNCSCKG